MSFNKNDSAIQIVDELIECINICIQNKKLWLTDKIQMVMLIAQEKPEFYSKRGRLIHSIVMYDDIKPLTEMLKKLYLAQQGKMDFQDISNEMVMNINTTFAPEATKKMMETIEKNKK